MRITVAVGWFNTNLIYEQNEEGPSNKINDFSKMLGEKKVTKKVTSNP